MKMRTMPKMMNMPRAMIMISIVHKKTTLTQNGGHIVRSKNHQPSQATQRPGPPGPVQPPGASQSYCFMYLGVWEFWVFGVWGVGVWVDSCLGQNYLGGVNREVDIYHISISSILQWSMAINMHAQHLCLCIYIHTYIYLCVYMYVSLSLSLYIYIYILCIYTCK